MKPRRTPSSNFTFRLDGGNEDSDLWVEMLVEDNKPIIRSVWQPTDNEREQLIAGANIELIVWGETTPPVSVGVTDEQPGKSKA